MRKFGLLMISVAGMAVAGSAALADAAPTPPPAPAATTQAANPSELDKMVCRMLAAPTGSRLGTRRECRTQREWDDIRQQQQKETGDMQSRGLTSGVKGQ